MIEFLHHVERVSILSLLNTVVNWADWHNIDCEECNHPADDCSGGCDVCLDEIHYWYGNPKKYRRKRYNCRALAFEYVKAYTERYYQNILFACRDIDFSHYDEISILSLGCGVAPDLMAFEKIFDGDYFLYRGIDDNKWWKEFHDIIYDYSTKRNFEVDFLKKSAFTSSKVYNDFYNVVVMQFFISSVRSEGGSTSDIRDLFGEIVDVVIPRWYNSKTKSPFLIILNDTDSLNTGRNLFFELLDLLESNGYTGEAFVQSAYPSGDLGSVRWTNREGQEGYGNFTYNYTQNTSNNSATLTIEVMK